MADGTPRQPGTGDQGQQPPPDAEMEGQGDLQPGQPVQHGDHHHGQAGQLAPQVQGQDYRVQQQAGPMHGQADQQAPPGQGFQVPQQAAPMMYHPGQLGYGAPVGIPPYQGFPAAPQQYNIPLAGPAAANTGPPALQMSVAAFGGATIRIQSPALAAGGLVAGASAAAAYAASKVAESPAVVVGASLAAGAVTGITTLVAFYMSNKQQTDEAIRRAVERERHIQVEQIEGGSLLVRVKFLTLAGYWVMRSLNERIDRGSDRTCLQLLLEDELQRIGWTGPIQVGMEGWWFAEEEGQQEEEEEEEEERWEWAERLGKQSVPPSVTTEGDSGLPEDVSSVAAMSIASAGEVEKGPLKWLRARLQKHKDSPTAQREFKAFRSWEEGADILTNSGYTDLWGVKALVLGFMQHYMGTPSFTSTVLYGQSWLNLNKAQLKKLVTSQLQADPTDSTCLLLTALQLPYGDSRVQTLQQVVAAILQHGPGDWLYQHLHHIYCYLGWAIWAASPQPKPTMVSKLSQGSDLPTTNLSALAKALSTMASSLMYKQDHLDTVYYTAELSKEVSETETIRQWEHFLSLAPECDDYVPRVHYYLATLYNQQKDRQKVIHHFTMGQQREANRLPGFPKVSRSIKDPARKAYEHYLS
ncbi:Hypp1553 [Branchiostoma lanceolatum]|uniref:Hypp1553 protein n=1 Tax=Branchiostoma lanceolatum TaxID=7740 RepID=A0A8K0EPD4_BRALA|nr:Hypp1553 [Branchiostoma lanceolatum]